MSSDLAVLTSWQGISVDPMIRTAGLPLLLRGVLTLQSAGARRILVALPEEARCAYDHVNADPRVDSELQFATIAPDDSPLSACPSDEPLLLCRYDVIAPASLYRSMRESDEKILLANTPDKTTGAMMLDKCEGRSLSALESDPAASRFDTSASWMFDATTASGRRRATSALFRDCRKPVDGVISRHLNRHVSLFISRVLVGLPVTPNMMTFATFCVALFAAYYAAQGGYFAVATAGVLMQFNSILDGCDGELARVRYQGSKLGQWLDTIGDDASNVIFWAALAWGARVMDPYGPYYALGGLVAALSNAVAAIANYVVLAKIGSGDFYALDEGKPEPAGGVVGAVVGFFEVILKQDFFLFLVMCLALGGVLEPALPIIAIGGVITMVHSLARTIRFFLRHS